MPPGVTCRAADSEQNSAERTACFERRVTLIEAFLDHDNGDAGLGGTGRAALTTGFPDEQEVPLVAQNPSCRNCGTRRHRHPSGLAACWNGKVGSIWLAGIVSRSHWSQTNTPSGIYGTQCTA